MEAAHVLASYRSHGEADTAIRALGAAGFDVRMLSVVGSGLETEERAVGISTPGDRMIFGSAIGAIVGALFGLLIGSALSLAPRVGPVLVASASLRSLAVALEGAAVGGTLGLFFAALVSFVLHDEPRVKYRRELRTRRFVLLTRGAAEKVPEARAILAREPSIAARSLLVSGSWQPRAVDVAS